MDGIEVAIKPRGWIQELEVALKLRLQDRLLLIIAGLGLYINLMLSLLANRYPEQAKTFDLLARLVLVIEVTLILAALLMAWQTARRCIAGPAVTISRISLGLSGLLVLPLIALIELLPLLYLHQYPSLAEQGIHVPVTLLQRVLLVMLGVAILYSLLLALLIQLRLPALAALPASLALYGWYTISVSRLTHANARWGMLNDLYYWNQLWHHIPEFPNLATERAIHNVGQPLLGLALTIGLFGAAVTTLLWLPAAAKLDRRETPE